MNMKSKSDWAIAQAKLKARWAVLTDDDLQFAEVSTTNCLIGFRSALANPVKQSKRQSKKRVFSEVTSFSLSDSQAGNDWDLDKTQHEPEDNCSRKCPS